MMGLGAAASRLALLAGLAIVGILAFTGIASANDPDVYLFTTRPSNSVAGGHPDVITEMSLASHQNQNGPVPPCECHDPRNIGVHTPAGVIANPHVVSVCDPKDIPNFECSADAQVGAAIIHLQSLGWLVLPIYRTVPQTGQAALFVFSIPTRKATPQYLAVNARTGSDFGLDFRFEGLSHAVPPDFTATLFWGVPGLEQHDMLRMAPGMRAFQCATDPTAAIFAGELPVDCNVEGPGPKKPIRSSLPIAPFTQNPTTCVGPLESTLDVLFYDHTTAHGETSWPATTGCDKLVFTPSLAAAPTTEESDSASGLAVDLKVPQFQAADTPSPSELRANRVELPPGFSINPNAADGKVACTSAQANFGNESPAECPENSKIGTTELDSSALPGPIFGYIYLGTPLPENRWRIFLTASGFGTNVKLEGSAHLDTQTGRIVTTFENLPQTPFQEFNLHFFGSERGLFATPTQCGTFAVNSMFTPWASELSDQTSTQFFDVSSGPEGKQCPNGHRPFAPDFGAGVEDNTAGISSPFSLEIRRADGDQYLSALHVSTPPGFLASLKGIPFCSESQIAQLMSSGYSGAAEQGSSACPAASQVGTAIAGAGAGTHPVYVPGRVFLAGPYKGAPLSLVISVPALSGPYDLGVVAVRAALNVDKETAQVAALSDPLPLIQEGVPLRTRFIRVNLDRPGFALNPTNCSPGSVRADLSGDEGATATAAAHFQIANCGDLPFRPDLSLQIKGSSKRRAHPGLHVTVGAQPGEANIARNTVALPPSLILDNSHIGDPCTRVEFAAGRCPDSSLIGSARASTPLLNEPLEGSVFLRSNPTGVLPNLVVALKGIVSIDLVGEIDSTKAGGLRTTFTRVPDAPITKFTLDLVGGKKGLLQNTENLCSSKQTARIAMVGQNGIARRGTTRIKGVCGGGPHGKRGQRRHRRAESDANRRSHR